MFPHHPGRTARSLHPRNERHVRCKKSGFCNGYFRRGEILVSLSFDMICRVVDGYICLLAAARCPVAAPASPASRHGCRHVDIAGLGLRRSSGGQCGATWMQVQYRYQIAKSDKPRPPVGGAGRFPRPGVLAAAPRGVMIPAAPRPRLAGTGVSSP